MRTRCLFVSWSIDNLCAKSRAFKHLWFWSAKCVLADPKRWSLSWRKSWRGWLWNSLRWQLLTHATQCAWTLCCFWSDHPAHPPEKSNLAAHKPVLTISMKAKSLRFAKAYEHLTSVDENAPWCPPGAKWEGPRTATGLTAATPSKLWSTLPVLWFGVVFLALWGLVACLLSYKKRHNA
jgi:hypothetical protein